jgi:hypothetical protein
MDSGKKASRQSFGASSFRLNHSSGFHHPRTSQIVMIDMYKQALAPVGGPATPHPALCDIKTAPGITTMFLSVSGLSCSEQFPLGSGNGLCFKSTQDVRRSLSRHGRDYFTSLSCGTRHSLFCFSKLREASSQGEQMCVGYAVHWMLFSIALYPGHPDYRIIFSPERFLSDHPDNPQTASTRSNLQPNPGDRHGVLSAH